MKHETRWLRTPQSLAALTLLEIMIVVAILGMIIGVVGVGVMDRLEKARVETARIEIHGIMDGLEFFYLDQKFYPTSAQGLAALVTNPGDERIADWPENGYLSRVPKDPWNNKYKYISPGANGRYDIICYGRDGIAGGTGYDADIQSWELHGEK